MINSLLGKEVVVIAPSPNDGAYSKWSDTGILINITGILKKDKELYQLEGSSRISFTAKAIHSINAHGALSIIQLKPLRV